ncbi:MAG TPA: hypothetical protein VI027_01420 [Rubrobacteraceae bacterium]
MKKPSEANDISEPLAAAAAPDPREGSVRASEGRERNATLEITGVLTTPLVALQLLLRATVRSRW